MAEYLEREALIDAFEYADADVCESYPDGYSEWGYGIQSVRDLIRSAPAANVAPVAHGLWKPATESEITGWNPGYAGYDPIGGYFCSNCSYEAIFTCNDEYELSAYCPNCGAKMEGGEE
jgi:hypothetical protein